MRLGEECPYITPCKWCTKFEIPCDEFLKEVKKRRMKKEKNNEQSNISNGYAGKL